jgi:hypothetical protein
MMHDIVAKMLNNQAGILTLMITVIVGFNVCLTSLKKTLGWIKDKTETKADDRAYELIAKLLGWTDKALEFASANSQALPPKAQAELAKEEWKEVPASKALTQAQLEGEETK